MSTYSVDLDALLTECEDTVRNSIEDQIRFAQFSMTSVIAGTDIPDDNWRFTHARVRRLEAALAVLNDANFFLED